MGGGRVVLHRERGGHETQRSAHEAHLGERLAEERLGVAGAVEREAVARIEAMCAGVVLRDPQVEGLVLLDSRIEELLADAGRVVRVER